MGLADRVRAVAPDDLDAALDAFGILAALDTSPELVGDRAGIGTVASPPADRLGRRLSTTAPAPS